MNIVYRNLSHFLLISRTYITVTIDILIARINRLIHTTRFSSNSIFLNHSFHNLHDPELLYRLLRFPENILDETDIETFYLPRFYQFLRSPLSYGVYTASCNLIDYCCYNASYNLEKFPRNTLRRVSKTIIINNEKRLNSNNHLLLNWLSVIYASILMGKSPPKKHMSFLFRLIDDYFDRSGCSIEGSSSYQYLFTFWFGRIYYYVSDIYNNRGYDYCLPIRVKFKSIYTRLLEYTSYLYFCTCKNQFTIGDITPDILGVNPYDHFIERDLKSKSSYPVLESFCLTSSIPYIISSNNAFTIGRLRNSHNNIVYNHSHHDYGCISWSYDGKPIIIDPGRNNYLSSDMLNIQSHSGVYLHSHFLPPSLGKLKLNKSFLNAIDELDYSDNTIIYTLLSNDIKWCRKITFTDDKGFLVIDDTINRLHCSSKSFEEPIDFSFHFSPEIHVNYNIPNHLHHQSCLTLVDYAMSPSYGVTLKAKKISVKSNFNQLLSLCTMIEIISHPDIISVSCKFNVRAAY